jgi:hypothetical protein
VLAAGGQAEVIFVRRGAIILYYYYEQISRKTVKESDKFSEFL